MNALLEKLKKQYLETQEMLRGINEEIAGREDNEPTEAEAANLAELNGTAEKLRARIEPMVESEKSASATAELLATAPGDVAGKFRALSTPQVTSSFDDWGDFARARATGDANSEQVSQILDLWGRLEHARAFVDVTTGDVPGITPPAWLKDIVDFIGAARPFVTAFSSIPLPDSGMTVNYPRVTQRPQVAKQAAQKTDIASRKTTISSEVANVETFAGGEDVALQVLQRTDPAYLAIMLELYAEEMAIAMDVEAITVAIASIPAPNTIQLTGPEMVNKVLASAAAMVLRARAVPNTFVVGLGIWEFLAGASDADGRPLFPNIGPSNPVGSLDITGADGTARGITTVADPNMDDDDGVLGWDRAFTSMLAGTQTLAADVPSKVGQDHAVYEFAAFAPRRPDALVLVKAPLGGSTTGRSTKAADKADK